MRVGYACICLGKEGLRCQRTTVLRNASPARLRELIAGNLAGLEAILQHNQERGIRLFRMGNELIPFASHPVNRLRWWEEFGAEFRRLGRWVREHGHRLSFHASHYTILNSQNPEVVESALADLIYTGRVLEAMELGPEHKVILHVGVTSPDPAAAMGRFEEAVGRLPGEARRHLAIENDDRLYPADQVVPLARRLGLPVVLDVFHHACLPGEWGELACAELMERAFATWTAADGPPKIHFSSQEVGKRAGAHGYWIDPGELRRFLAQSAGVSRDFDVMFEAKGKDLALEAVLPVLREDPRFQESAGRPVAVAA